MCRQPLNPPPFFFSATGQPGVPLYLGTAYNLIANHPHPKSTPCSKSLLLRRYGELGLDSYCVFVLDEQGCASTPFLPHFTSACWLLHTVATAPKRTFPFIAIGAFEDFSLQYQLKHPNAGA
jgi:hypothetical protein